MMTSNRNAGVPKAKSSKSAKDASDSELGNTGESGDGNSTDHELGDNGRYHGYPREGRYGRSSGRTRTRSTEFRPSSRGTSSRGDSGSGFRGRRREPTSRRSAREYDYEYSSGRKYDTRGNESAYRGKFYEPEKKSDIKLNLPEDTRISKLLRRLNIETYQENSLVISKKLLEVLLLPDNAPYIRKSFHILGESMYEIIHVSPGTLAKQQAARCLGRMGYIMAQEADFERYHNWLFSKMSGSYEEMQILLIRSLKETFDLDAEKPVLEEGSADLIANLVAAIETTENPEVFKAILEILVMVIQMYPNDFYDQFRDTIDLLFGWHVDHNQPLGNIEFVSRSLQKLSQHFKYHLEFCVSLVENFLEDITNYAAELGAQDSLEHVTVLILAMNTVLKCLQESFHPANNKFVTVEFINTSLTRIIKTLTDALEGFLPDNLTIASNECISLLLSCLDTKSQTLSNSIYNLIDLELSYINDFSDNTVVSLLLLIARAIKELSANLPAEVIDKLIGPNSDIVKLRSSPFPHVQNAVICVYQSLLNLKNVSLLQEAYRYVLGDLERYYTRIVPSFVPFVENNPFEEPGVENPQQTAMCLLRCLSQLANASSIIVMWALKPSILELAGVLLKPYDATLAKKTPYLQFSLLYLLYSHCKCYNHFISSSNLVTKRQDAVPLNRFGLTEGLSISDVPSTSPNSGNFEVILDVLYRTLKIETSIEVTLLLLQWLNDILMNSDSYLETFYQQEQFSKVTKALVKCGYHYKNEVAKAVCENLEKLLSTKTLAWNDVFLTNASDLCKLHMNSNDPAIRECYSRLSCQIPWDITVVALNKVNTINKIENKSSNLKEFNGYMVYMSQSLHLSGSVDGEILPQQFKTFMDYLLRNSKTETKLLKDIFTSCWALESESQMNMELFYDIVMNSRQVLNNWCTLEAAQYCINNKLRTPLGKPNETFTKIESALNQLGNDLIMIRKNNENMSKTDGNRVRLLLQFVEHLEKSIYNASEGSAVAMPQATKSVRSFFIANTNTCNEWLSRIRMVVMHIALHCGESGIALKHGQALLKEFNTLEKADTPEFERVAMFVTLALLNLKEPEALSGLYAWCKSRTGKRFNWIRWASEQASKKYEIAVEGYKKMLKESKEKIDKQLEPEICGFVSDQIIVCYKELNNLPELLDWYAVNTDFQNGKKYWFNQTDWDFNKNLYDFESGCLALSDLASWCFRKEGNSWSTYENLGNTESNIYNIGFNLAAGTNVAYTGQISKSLSTIHEAIQDHLPLAPSEFLQDYSLLQYVATGLKNVSENMPAHTVFLISEHFENEIEKIDTSILRKILWWSDYFSKVQNQGFNLFSSNLRLDIIKRARKEKNNKLAMRHIFKFFKDKDVEFSTVFNMNEFMEKLPDINLSKIDTAKAVSEVIKVCYTNEDTRPMAFHLCASVSTALSKYADIYGSIEHRKISSKILLKLAGWLQNSDNVNVAETTSPLGKLTLVLPEIGMMENVANNIIPMNEMAIGKLLQFSVHQCPTLAKSWNAFGTWCYRWGKKIVDQSSDIKNNLSEEHIAEIRRLLPLETSEADLNKIFLILSQRRSIIIDDEDIASNDINTSDMIQSQLKEIDVLEHATEDHLKSLVQIWRKTQNRIYSYYALAAEAYFKYLHLVLNSENITKSSECNTITITLRLLRLIVKYALELQGILEEGLQKTPTQPWKVIIPQLFSRLNHPESYVRLRVSDLLCRVAEDAPQLITFPAVVGALEGGLKFDFSEIQLPKDCLSQNNEDGDDDADVDDNVDYESDNDDTTNTLQVCFKSMVETLSKQDPETITQVQTLVKELRRITLLWDELWLGTLAQHQSEISKRQNQLEYEIEKVNDNLTLTKEEKVSLIAEKHRIIIKPIIFILEQLNDVTNVEPETPHEKEFQEKYQEDIIGLIGKLKNPDHPEKPQITFGFIKQLQKKFQQKLSKRSSYTLKMQDISPVLHGIKNTLIAMPGLATTGQRAVTIAYVSNFVSILPTKTKPKKLVFYGSDGQAYTYLFKGLEDLHLDERIMQFLSIANTMMAQNADPAGHNLYRARHYSVIPLGPRSGLISWVDGTTPVFALYKRWQQRELAKPNHKGTSTTNTTVPRPSELFYNKLMEHGVKNIDNRKEWPLNVLKEVLKELMAETPSDLIAKELWCNSISANAWWQVVKRYSYSVAVMSIIGYIIGLGDRHLDNVLIDLATGDVVHIDYNVCFEKGKTLRVPEKVPFRLTPNIREAFGVTGIEGIFRLACENVLKIMRKGRETLLTLLEAFVYDPLIDWTVGGEVLAGTTFNNGLRSASEGGPRQSKKELEKEVTLAMFNVRCTEIRVEWNENKEEILHEIPTLISHLKTCLSVSHTMKLVEDQLQDLHQQLALIKEAEAQGPKKHPLYKLPSFYDAYIQSQEALNIAKKGLTEIIKDCESHAKTFAILLDLFEKQQFSQWLHDLKMNYVEQDDHIFDLVKEFLHNAGKDDDVIQCEKSERETQKCIQTFQNYFSLLIQCPASYIREHRMELFAEWAQYLLDTKTVAGCDIVFEKFRQFLDEKVQNSAQIVSTSLFLDTFYQDTLRHVSKLYEELTTLQAKEPPSSLEKHYNNAKLNVTTFLRSEKGAMNAFKFVLAGELLLLNRAFLTQEIAANRSGDCLIKLTSRDGDWFLNDLLLHSTRAVEMVNNIPIRQDTDDARLYQVISGVRITNNVYKGLYDLNFNFHKIILPESMKKIQADEPSVLQMISDLNGLISSSEMSIPELMLQLDKLLTCVLMHIDVQNVYDYVLDQVAALKLKFLSLIPTQSESLSQGKMLLMGFNGLFEKLTQEINNLASALGNLDIPKSWKKLDHVKEAKNIAPHIFNVQVRGVLENIFFLKKILVIQEFFMLAQEMCQSIRCKAEGKLYNDEQLTKPVKQFIAEFVSKQLLGVTPETITYVICFLLKQLDVDVTHEIEQKDIGAESKVPLDELYQKAYNVLLKNGVFSSNVINQATSLEMTLKLSWEKIQEPKKIEQKLAILQSSAFRFQSQLAVHNLMFDEVLVLHKFASVRAKFLVEMQNELSGLQTLYNKLSEAIETQKSLTDKAYQRLNWAKGANPNVGEILAAFHNAVTLRTNQLNLEVSIASKVLTSFGNFLHHELLRSTTLEATKTYDQLFLNSYGKWRIACQYHERKGGSLSPAEENILNMLTYESIKDPKWLHQISIQVTDTIGLLQKKLTEKKENSFTCADTLVTLTTNFKSIYGIHTKLMSDMRGLLKTMTKLDEYSEVTQNFIQNYRKYVEHFNHVFGNFKEQSLEKEHIDEMLENLMCIEAKTENIYESLLELQENQKLRKSSLKSLKGLVGTEKENVKVQQRNAYAVNVWRRVKMKLEGRDPDPGRKCTAQEQVDFVIREATDLENLALLYEGWTPWV